MRATVIVPTHDHARTLPVAVGSALTQSVTDLEVTIVGDGVTAAVRKAARQLADVDPRVVFLDLPKGPNHGELHRHHAIRSAGSDAIFYLCDDDLLLPRHIENLLPLLQHADLVQCRNSWIDVDGELDLYPTDLSVPSAVAWHLSDPPRNATSLTGTAHTVAAYMRLETGWSTTPPGDFPDYFLWKQFFRMPGFRGATHPEVTAILLPTSRGREDWDQQRRLDELVWWRDRLGAPDGEEWLRERVVLATARQLDQTYRDAIDRGFEIARLTDEAIELRRRSAVAEERAQALANEVQRLTRERDLLLDSHSWRLTRPLRGAATWLHRDRRAGDGTR